MKKYGLLGKKLGHSYSQEIHALLEPYEYRLYEKKEDELEEFLDHTDLDGMNVTIPYKKTVMPYCVWLSETAQKMRCVNTLVKYEDGWHGYNTDYYGFIKLVQKNGIEVEGRKVLVLGSGGASNTVVRSLEDMGAGRIVVISRKTEDNYENISRHQDADVIVNATPVGMYPDNGVSPVDLKIFKNCVGVLDLIYNPARTALLIQAEELGIRNADGLYMLVAQAKRSAELFTDRTIDDGVIEKIVSELDLRMENIILTGMPGSGKTSVGKAVAKKLGREFIDTDRTIAETEGISIPEIFARVGEDGFRRIETAVLKETAKLSGKVISTGGGAVTREENYPILHQNGRIVWIKRDLDKLPVKGRPLSMTRPLEEIYRERKSRYEFFADYTVYNSDTVENAADLIIDLLKADLK